MERWYKLNMGFALGGVLLFIASMIFIKKMPLFLLSAMFGVGICFKAIKNLYKNEGPPTNKKTKNPYDSKKVKKKNK